MASRITTNPAESQAITTPLNIQGVRVTYPDGDSTLEVLKDVSVAPEPGKLTAVTGESGSGKSTLLTVSALLTKPFTGTVIINGQDAWALNENDRAALRRQNIGLVFQQPNLFASLTAHDQIMMAADVQSRLSARAGRKQANARADELLELVGLTGKGRRYPHELSGGQRQRVNIARALMNSPKILLADEPTSALDTDMSQEIVGLLGKVTKELGTATLMVTHDVPQLEQCDSVLQLVRGKLAVLR